MEVTMDEMIAALAGKYGLTMEQVRDALDLVLSGPGFRRATGAHFGEITADGIIVFGDRGAGCLGETRRSLSRVISHELERVLRDAATGAEYDRSLHLRGQVVAGCIESIGVDGTLRVAIAITGLFGETDGAIMGICTPRKQIPQERGALCPGETRMFLVERIAAIRRRGVSSVLIFLSRTSQRLPEKLLKRETKGKCSLACVKRVVGRVSYLVAQKPVPREAIVKVGRELNERIKVRHNGHRDRQKS